MLKTGYLISEEGYDSIAEALRHVEFPIEKKNSSFAKEFSNRCMWCPATEERSEHEKDCTWLRATNTLEKEAEWLESVEVEE